MPPGEQEISDKRDDAAEAAMNPDRQQYTEGVRDALAWVLGELEDGHCCSLLFVRVSRTNERPCHGTGAGALLLPLTGSIF